jgi:hypothetical protein
MAFLAGLKMRAVMVETNYSLSKSRKLPLRLN